MIGRAEILRFAGELSLRPEVVEKDYVLGWLLAGIAHNPALAGTWVFKGGTCLKKCYFETYRFSEDLDFTITDKAQLDRDFLVAQFTQIAAWLYDTTGIEIPADQLRFDAWDTSRGSRAGEGRLYYRGPLARGGALPRIKLDLTADEALVMLPVTRAVTHPYSDAPAEGLKALCYSYEEVFGEKVRALGERTRPRDLYDVVNLFQNGEFATAAATIRRIVQAKCNFKKIPFPTLTTIEPARDELIGEWSNMLGHQLPALPPIDSFLAALPEFFKWLAGEVAPRVLAAYPGAQESQVLRGPAGSIHVGGGASSIEVIRFAASNRLCVDLDYTDQEGKRSRRVIEPYSLRRTKDGNILLYGVRADNGQNRSYRVDQIQGARVTGRSFTPRYVVELTPMTSLATIPDTARRATKGGGAWSSGGYSGRLRATATGPTYVFRCTVCGRNFERKTYDGTLRAHKNRGGADCYGRLGIYIGRKH